MGIVRQAGYPAAKVETPTITTLATADAANHRRRTPSQIRMAQLQVIFCWCIAARLRSPNMLAWPDCEPRSRSLAIRHLWNEHRNCRTRDIKKNLKARVAPVRAPELACDPGQREVPAAGANQGLRVQAGLELAGIDPDDAPVIAALALDTDAPPC